jgi:hypothetical protein
MILESFEIPLYRGNVIVVIDSNANEINKIIPSFKEQVVYAHSYFDTFKGCQGFYLILNFENEFRNIKHGVITHECIHITNMIAHSRGIEADLNNDEPLTYLAEWICDSVYEVINKNNLVVR